MDDKSLKPENVMEGDASPHGEDYDSATALGTGIHLLELHPGDRPVDGRYEVMEEIGRGGMGIVYRCQDNMAGIEVALKALPPELSCNRIEMEVIRENFQLVSRLVHQNIAVTKNLEQDKATGDYYLVMEYVKGENLCQWMRRALKEKGAISPDVALPILRQIAEALDYAHEMKVMHRDVKPSNVMLTEDGKVKVTDFGLAAIINSSRSTVSGAYCGTSGTKAYMAPEQWRGKPQGASSDQYALAVMAYEMLSGHLPFDAADVAVLRMAVLEEAEEPIKGLPGYMNSALRRALSKDAHSRFPSCVDFVKALGGEGGRPWIPSRITVIAMLLILGGIWCLRSCGASVHRPSAVSSRPSASSGQPSTPSVADGMVVPPERHIVDLPGGVQLEMIKVEAGSFVMGRNATGCSVTLSHDYWLGKYEVTCEQYMAVMGAENQALGTMNFSGSDCYPVNRVGWKDAREFCAKVTALEREAGRLPEGYVYELPTEAQWEYAARGGKRSKGYIYSGSNDCDEVAWFYANAGQKHLDYHKEWDELKALMRENQNKEHPVGLKKANELGFHDMSGNLWEWCLDRGNWTVRDITQYSLEGGVDPCGASGQYCIVRGGCFFLYEANCDTTMRFCVIARSSSNIGFRIALVHK